MLGRWGGISPAGFMSQASVNWWSSIITPDMSCQYDHSLSSTSSRDIQTSAFNSAHRSWWGQGVDMGSEETILCAIFRFLWPLHIAVQQCLSALVAVRIRPSKVAQTRPHLFSPYFTLMNFLYSCWEALDSVNKWHMAFKDAFYLAQERISFMNIYATEFLT